VPWGVYEQEPRQDHLDFKFLEQPPAYLFDCVSWHLRGTYVLSYRTSFTRGYSGATYPIEKRRLAVVDVPKYRNYRLPDFHLHGLHLLTVATTPKMNYHIKNCYKYNNYPHQLLLSKNEKS